jgi:hypothetical protein
VPVIQTLDRGRGLGRVGAEKRASASRPSRDEAPIITYYRTKTIDGIKIFYREAGRLAHSLGPSNTKS